MTGLQRFFFWVGIVASVTIAGLGIVDVALGTVMPTLEGAYHAWVMRG